MAASPHLVRAFIAGIREGWAALDRRNVRPASRSLRAIFCWVPLPLAVTYWRRLLHSPRGDLYFAAHTRHAPNELAVLADDVRGFIENDPAPTLRKLDEALDLAATNRTAQIKSPIVVPDFASP